MRNFLLVIFIALATGCATTKRNISISERDIGLDKASFFKKYSGGITLQRVATGIDTGIEVYTNVAIPGYERIFVIFENVNKFNKCPFSSSGECRYSYAKLNKKPIYTTDWAGTGRVAGFFSESDLNTDDSLISKALSLKIKEYDTEKALTIKNFMHDFNSSYEVAYGKWIVNGQNSDDANLTGEKTRETSLTWSTTQKEEARETLHAWAATYNNHTPKKSFNQPVNKVLAYKARQEKKVEQLNKNKPQQSLLDKLIGAAIDVYKFKKKSEVTEKNLRKIRRAARAGERAAIRKANLQKRLQKTLY